MYLTQRETRKKKPSNQTKGYRDDDPLRKVHTPTPVSHQSAIYAVATNTEFDSRQMFSYLPIPNEVDLLV
jgi:hypothetical protein